MKNKSGKQEKCLINIFKFIWDYEILYNFSFFDYFVAGEPKIKLNIMNILIVYMHIPFALYYIPI